MLRHAVYLSSTEPPASSIFFFIPSASAFGTPSFTGFGAPSTRSLASLRPSPVSSRTTLITWIFLSPEPVRTTVKSSFSGAAAAAAPAGAPPAAATATGAAADTPSSASSSFTSVAASIRLMFFRKSFTCSRVTSMSCVSFKRLARIACAGSRSCSCFGGGRGFGGYRSLGRWRRLGTVRDGAVRERRHQARQPGGRFVEGSQERCRGGLQHAEQLGQHHLSRWQFGERLHLGRRQHLAVEERPADLELGKLVGQLDRDLRDGD